MSFSPSRMVIIPLYRWVTWGQTGRLTCAPSLVKGRQNQEGVDPRFLGVCANSFHHLCSKCLPSFWGDIRMQTWHPGWVSVPPFWGVMQIPVSDLTLVGFQVADDQSLLTGKLMETVNNVEMHQDVLVCMAQDITNVFMPFWWINIYSHST